MVDTRCNKVRVLMPAAEPLVQKRGRERGMGRGRVKVISARVELGSIWVRVDDPSPTPRSY